MKTLKTVIINVYKWTQLNLPWLKYVVLLTLNKPKKRVANGKVLFRSHKNISKINTTINVTIVSYEQSKTPKFIGISERDCNINA